jgi:hypothetical protein
MPAILLLKLTLVPLLIYAVTLAGRRWGPAVAGWMSAFPIVAGPILLTLTLEQGAPFAATAAEGTLTAVLAILVFTLAYAWAAVRHGMWGSMLRALAAYAVAVALLRLVELPLLVRFGLVIAGLAVTPRLFPPAQVDAVGKGTGSDLAWRMLAAAVLVLTVTFGATQFGPRLSGFFAMFPVMSTVLVGFSHVQSGPAFAVSLLRGMVTGYYAFAVFCTVLSLGLRVQPVGLAFAMAFGCALVVQLLARRLGGVGRVAPASRT